MIYKIVTYALAKIVEDEVNKLLGEGWRLHGSVAVAKDEGIGSEIYAQAMVRDEESGGEVDFVSSGEKQGHAMLKGL